MMTAQAFDGAMIGDAAGGDKRDVFAAALEKLS
jgi:hypothetical protein